MSTPCVKAYFDGPPEANGEVYLDDLSALCNQIGACLRATEEAITKSKPKSRYRLDSLSRGSISFAIAPSESHASTDTAALTIDLFNQTVKSLQEGLTVDSRLGRETLEVYRRLAGTLLHKARVLKLSEITITTQFIAQVDKLLGNEVVSRGSFKGRIERLNIHNKNECVLFSPLRKEGITCSFDKELYKQVHAAMDQSVTVVGTLRFDGDSAFPSRINIKSLQIHTRDGEMPTLASLKGLIDPIAIKGNAMTTLKVPRMEDGGLQQTALT